MSDRRIEYVPLTDVVPADRNAKRHDTATINASLTRFGYVEAIVRDDRTGKLVAGHGRVGDLNARYAAGEDPPDGVTVDEDGVWRVPVLVGWSSLDDSEADAAGIALNRIGEQGGWYPDVLSEMLTNLAAVDGGLVGVGYDTDHLDDLLARLAPPVGLDDLAAQYGEPSPESMWPVVRVQVAPENRARYLALVAEVQGDDNRKFAHLLDLAESAIGVGGA